MLDESIYIRMDTELKKKLEELAAADERSVAAYIRRILKSHAEGGMVIKNADLTRVDSPPEIRAKRTKPLAMYGAGLDEATKPLSDEVHRRAKLRDPRVRATLSKKEFESEAKAARLKLCPHGNPMNECFDKKKDKRCVE